MTHGYLEERYVNFVYALVVGRSAFGCIRTTNIWKNQRGVKVFVRIILDSLPTIGATIWHARPKRPQE